MFETALTIIIEFLPVNPVGIWSQQVVVSISLYMWRFGSYFFELLFPLHYHSEQWLPIQLCIFPLSLVLALNNSVSNKKINNTWCLWGRWLGTSRCAYYSLLSQSWSALESCVSHATWSCPSSKMLIS